MFRYLPYYIYNPKEPKEPNGDIVYDMIDIIKKINMKKMEKKSPKRAQWITKEPNGDMIAIINFYKIKKM